MPLVPVSQRTGYTIQEVAEHKTPKSLWVIINRKVYDVTSFYKWHPGGPNVLMQMGGKDATAAAAAAHKNALPANLMWEYCIGSIVRFKVKPAEPLEPAPAPAPAPALASAAPNPKAKAKVAAAKARSAISRILPSSATGGVEAAAAANRRSATPTTTAVTKVAAPATSPAVSPRVVVIQDKSDSADGANGNHTDDEGAEHGSHGDGQDDEIATALAGDSALRIATGILCDMVREDASLERFVASNDPAALERQMHEFLKTAFDGADWPGIKVTRSLVEQHFPEFVQALWDTMKGPLPLGEDTFLSALEKLTTNSPSGRESRVARFFEAIRDVLFTTLPSTGSRVGRATTRKAPAPPTVGALAGKWRDGGGVLCSVAGDLCTFDGKDVQQITVGDGLPCLRGWIATSVTPKRVEWRAQGGTKMEWIKEASVGSNGGYPQAHDIKVMEGLWQSSQGRLCAVWQGNCTCTTGASGPLTSQAGGAIELNGWKTTSVTPTEVKWDRSGQSMWWSRFASPKDVTALVGVWKNTDGLVCTVAEGQCNFIPKGSPALVLKDGVLSLNGWNVTAITEKKVSWMKSGQSTKNSMEWDRIEQVDDIEGLGGSWSTSDGLQCDVEGAVCSFRAPANTIRLTMKDGLPALNAWRAVAIRGQSISWRKAGKELEWKRA
mmetsp:Transcript_173282/g.550109  ORF Transcript_173282/g.550109 Transcript_173282/m.550109 type:complete len:665 (+) Transcript_173282:111-2105(+)